MKVLVTGAAGFIGMHVTLALLARGDEVTGLDNLNDYYDVSLKLARLQRLRGPGFQWAQADVADRPAMEAVFARGGYGAVVHLAAQAGVRYSVTHPHAYAQSNLVGFLNVLEESRRHRIGHLVYASSSSVYGGNRRLPFAEADPVDHPVSLYAATKKANELMAHSYSHLYGMPATGLRFFTVYGPWGRPDMAYYSFTRDMLAGRSIAVYNQGRMRRDFTFVDDIVDGVLAVLDRRPLPGPGGAAPHRVLNIGSHQPVPLLDFIGELERALSVRAVLDYQPMQPGDVTDTFADVQQLHGLTGQQPETPLREGIERFVAWYLDYHGQAHTRRQRA